MNALRTLPAAIAAVTLLLACNSIVGVGDYVVAGPTDAGVDAGPSPEAGGMDGMAESSDDASADDADAEEAGPGADEAATAFANAVCQKGIQCIGTSGYVDLATCESREKQFLLDILIAPGHGYTPALELACASQVNAASCKQYWDGVPCDVNQAGSLSNGSPCGSGSQCSTDTCAINTNANCGLCSAPKSAGQSCQNSTECKPGLYCGGGTCAAIVQAGGTCNSNVFCEWDLTCRNGACAASGLGVACTVSLQDCPPYQFCSSSTNTCQSFSWALPGSSCGWVNGDNSLWTDCLAGAFCNVPAQQSVSTCPQVAQDGQSCDGVMTFCTWPSACIGGTCTADHPQNCK